MSTISDKTVDASFLPCGEVSANEQVNQQACASYSASVSPRSQFPKLKLDPEALKDNSFYQTVLLELGYLIDFTEYGVTQEWSSVQFQKKWQEALAALIQSTPSLARNIRDRMQPMLGLKPVDILKDLYNELAILLSYAEKRKMVKTSFMNKPPSGYEQEPVPIKGERVNVKITDQPKFSVDAGFQGELYNFENIKGSVLPAGWSKAKKKYIFQNKEGKHVNYRGTLLEDVQAHQRPTIYAIPTTDGRFMPKQKESEEWQMKGDVPKSFSAAGVMISRSILENPACHQPEFFHWLRMYSKLEPERKRFASIHAQSPARLVRIAARLHFPNLRERDMFHELLDCVTGTKIQRRVYRTNAGTSRVAEFEEEEFQSFLGISELANAVDSTGNGITQQLERFNASLEALRNAYAGEGPVSSRITGLIKFIARVAQDIVALCYISDPTGLKIYCGLALAYWAAWAADFPIGKFVLTHLKALFTGCMNTLTGRRGEEFQAKDAPEVGESLVSAITQFIGNCFGMPVDNSMLMRRINMIRGFDNLLTTGQKTAKILKEAVVYALDWLSGQKPWTKEDMAREIKDWLVEASVFEQCASGEYKKISEIFKDRQQRVKLASVIMNGKKLSRKIIEMGLQSSNYSIIERKLDKLDRLVANIAPTASGDVGAEMRPVAIYIYGDAGVGKSKMVDNLMTDVYKLLGREPYDARRDKYFKQKTSEYNDGYVGQDVWYIDDMFVTTDTESMIQDAKAFMEITAGDVCHLNMAACEAKMNTYFSSSFVIATSNQSLESAMQNAYIGSYMSEAKALTRRVRLHITMKDKKSVSNEDSWYDRKIFDVKYFDDETQMEKKYSVDYAKVVQLVAKMYLSHKIDAQRPLGALTDEQIERMKETLDVPNSVVAGGELIEPELVRHQRSIPVVAEIHEDREDLQSSAPKEDIFFDAVSELVEDVEEWQMRNVFTSDLNEDSWSATMWHYAGVIPRALWAHRESGAIGKAHLPLNVSFFVKNANLIAKCSEYTDHVCTPPELGKPWVDYIPMPPRGDCQLRASVQRHYVGAMTQENYDKHMTTYKSRTPQEWYRSRSIHSDPVPGDNQEFLWAMTMHILSVQERITQIVNRDVNTACIFRNMAVGFLIITSLRLLLYGVLNYFPKIWKFANSKTRWSTELDKIPLKRVYEEEIIDRDVIHTLPNDKKAYRHCHECESCGIQFSHKCEIETCKNMYMWLCKKCGGSKIDDLLTKHAYGEEESYQSLAQKEVKEVACKLRFAGETMQTAEKVLTTPREELQSVNQQNVARAMVRPKMLRHEMFQSHEPGFKLSVIKETMQSGDDVRSVNDVLGVAVTPANHKTSTFDEATSDYCDELKELFRPASQDVASIQSQLATSRNYVSIKTASGIANNGIILAGRTVMTNAHFMRSIEKNGVYDVYVSVAPIRNIHVRLTGSQINFHTELDVATFNLPKSEPCFRDITNHFVDLDSVPVPGNPVMTGHLTSVAMHENKAIFTQRLITNIQTGSSYTDNASNVCIENTAVYDYPSAKGDCGLMVYLSDKGTARKILGMHIAGVANKTGRCVILPRNVVKKLVADCESLEQPRIYYPNEENQSVEIMPLWDVDSIETVGELELAGCGGDTEFVPSMLHGVVYPIEKVPTRTRPHYIHGEKVQPLDKAEPVNNFVHIEEELLTMAKQDFHDATKMHDTDRYEKRLLTFEEAVNGIRDESGKTDEWLGGMEMKTSPGYPLSQDRTKPGKFDYVEARPDGTYEVSEKVKEMYDDLEKQVVEGKMEPIYFVDTPKDELLETQKVREKGKVRIFSLGPFHANLLWRKYFGPYTSMLMEMHNHGEVKVGLNVHSDEWREFVEYLELDREHRQIIGGDWKSWDKSVSYQLAMCFVDLANMWYDDGEENKRIRRNLAELFFSSFHLNQGKVYRVFGTIPSGFPSTSVANSVVNAILMRVLFMKCYTTRYNVPADLSLFYKNVRWSFYGDDNLATVTRAVGNFYNMKTIAAEAAKYNMTYTHPSKDKELTEFLTLSEASFIKRTFRFVNHQVFAPLDEVSLRNIVNWRRKSNPPFEAMKAAFDSFRIECIHFGREYYDLHVTKLRDACLERGLWLRNKDYERLYSEVWGKFKPLGKVSAESVSKQMLMSFAEMETHHLISEEYDSQLNIKSAKWCPRYGNPKARGGSQVAHHVCPRCNKESLHLVKWIVQGKEWKCCMRCLGVPTPDWYFHEADKCVYCTGTLKMQAHSNNI